MSKINKTGDNSYTYTVLDVTIDKTIVDILESMSAINTEDIALINKLSIFEELLIFKLVTMFINQVANTLVVNNTYFLTIFYRTDTFKLIVRKNDVKDHKNINGYTYGLTTADAREYS